MRTERLVLALGLAVSVAAISPVLRAQEGAPPVSAPALTPAEMEKFLQTAEIVKTRTSRKGVTDAKQVTLSDGNLTHDAQVQDVDIALPIFNVDPKHTEVNFKDSYRYNIAGYRLALMLGLDNVPMSVERKVAGKPAAMTWWVDGVAFDEGGRQKRKTMGPNPLRTSNQLHLMKVFDELIQNRDRNAGNLLWTDDWKMWMIDHTRAFRLGKSLLKPDSLQRCDRTMYEKMQALTADGLKEVMGDSLKKEEIEALLARRDEIVKIFSDKIATLGDGSVLFTLN